MRIHVMHATTYRYATPAKYVIQKLRLTPRGHDGQHVRRWRIEIDHDCKLSERRDAFGNIVHTFTLMGTIDSLRITVDGDVETEDTAGVVSGAVERLPRPLYLRETNLTRPDAALEDYARRFASRPDRLDLLHELLADLHSRMTFDTTRTDSGTSAAEAFRLGHGVCQDFTHIFIAAARTLGIPARYVSGYFLHEATSATSEAGHAWAEAHVSDLGWVAFDPANGVCANANYVRVAIGLDYLDAAPVRGSQSGGTAEELGVRVDIRDASVQQ